MRRWRNGHDRVRTKPRQIDLSLIDSQIGAAGDQAFNFIGLAAFSNVQGQLRYQAEGANTRLQADMDGDGLADFEIILIGTVSPTAADFML
jgi:serralysin